MFQPSCPTKLKSSYRDTILSPLVHSLPTYLHDTSNALCHFHCFQFPNSNWFVFIMDGQFLYTSIPPQGPNQFPSINNSTSFRSMLQLWTNACIMLSCPFERQCLFQSEPRQAPTLYTTLMTVPVLPPASVELNSFITFAADTPLLCPSRTLPYSGSLCLHLRDRPGVNIHYKPTDFHGYLHYSSSHPASRTSSITLSLFLRPL